ncbi:hypothetical protein CFC21_034422 [Triticum aestivum]|uniref:F-box domain-containing protein n=2 Tax=Triticum aestivum TaxID=4565 RepID=A0A9R1F3M7_WHEAT|nr:hypothetical protein CFC21_034422 [Triticum aestivum]
MAGDSSPTESPPAKLPTASNPTYIDRIDEDILREIFLLLPSLAALVRAACTCRAWRSAVASAPAFRRRFREVHRAPLIGLFFQVPPPSQTPNLPAFPAFFPARRRDRDLVAAIRCGDFFLTSIQERPDESLCWDIIDSRHGYILLMNWDEGLLCLFNPLLRWSKTFDLGPMDLFYGSKGAYAQLDPQLVYSDENPMSFRVVMLCTDRSRVPAAVLSSETWEWSVLPWVEVPARPAKEKLWLQDECSMQANGFLYCVYTNQKFMITLDAKTMEFSVAELPQCLQNPRCHFVLAEANHSRPCIVYASDFSIGVLLCEPEGDNAGSWYLDKVFDMHAPLTQILEAIPQEVNVVAIMDGFAYLATVMDDEPQNSPWLLSLCLETMELVKLFRVAFDAGVHPYVLAWPSALVGNYGAFALGNSP